MKFLRLLMVFILVVLVSLCASVAVAQENVIGWLEKNEGPSHVLLRVGHSPTCLKWLGVSLALSGIDPSEVHRLPVGKEIVVPAGCGNEPPPKAAQLSRKILSGKYAPQPVSTEVFEKEIAQLKQDNLSLKDALGKEQEASEIANSRVRELQEKLGEANARNQELERQLQTRKAPTKDVQIGLSLIGFFLGMVVMGVGLGLYFPRKFVYFRDEKKILFHGKQLVFTDAQWAPHHSEPHGRSVLTRRCPKCSQRIKDGNELRHLETHPELRTETQERQPTLVAMGRAG